MDESEQELLQKLIPPRKTEVTKLPISGIDVTIQSVTFGEMMMIYKQAKTDALEFSKWLIFKGLIKPKITESMILDMNPRDATELVTQIMNISGYSPESMELLKKQASMTIPSESGI